MYYVIDTHTQRVMTKYKTLKMASRMCDRLDNEYGAVRYVYKYVKEN